MISEQLIRTVIQDINIYINIKIKDFLLTESCGPTNRSKITVSVMALTLEMILCHNWRHNEVM